MYEIVRFTPGKSALYSIQSRQMPTLSVGRTVFSLAYPYPFSPILKSKRHDRTAVPPGRPCMRSDRLRL